MMAELKHTHNWDYLNSEQGKHVTRECRCGWIKETTPRHITYFNENGGTMMWRPASIHETDELNSELNADMQKPHGMRGPKT